MGPWSSTFVRVSHEVTDVNRGETGHGCGAVYECWCYTELSAGTLLQDQCKLQRRKHGRAYCSLVMWKGVTELYQISKLCWTSVYLIEAGLKKWLRSFIMYSKLSIKNQNNMLRKYIFLVSIKNTSMQFDHILFWLCDQHLFVNQRTPCFFLPLYHPHISLWALGCGLKHEILETGICSNHGAKLWVHHTVYPTGKTLRGARYSTATLTVLRLWRHQKVFVLLQ